MELFETSDAALSYAWRSVSKEEQKYQKDRFNEVFGPILLENGFLKKGTRYYRLYENRFLQIVEFARWGHWGPGQVGVGCMTYYPFGHFTQALRYENDGHWIFFERPYSYGPKMIDVLLEEFVGEVCAPGYKGTDGKGLLKANNRALYIVKNFDDAMQWEYELFVRKALPELNRIKDLDAYQAMKRRVYSPQTHGRFTPCAEHSPYTYDRFYSMLEEAEWEKAENCLQNMIEKTKIEVDERQDALQKALAGDGPDHADIWNLNESRAQLAYEEELLKRVMQRDAAWREQFMGRIQELTYAELNRLSPRILKNPVKAL